MCGLRVEAHAEPMISFDLTTALVHDRQRTLRDEAGRTRLARVLHSRSRRRPWSRRPSTRRPEPGRPGTGARPAQRLRPPRTLPPATALAAWQHDQRAA